MTSTDVVAASRLATPDPAGAGAAAVALRRPASWPEGLGASTLLVLPVMVGWDRLTALLGRTPACLVRTELGGPCPLCGGITAGHALLDLDVATAVVANPLAVGLAMVAVTMLGVWSVRMAGLMPPPRRWSPATSRASGLALTVALLLSWVYQVLARTAV